MVAAAIRREGSSSMSNATAAEDAEDCSATSLMPESKKEEGKGEMGGVVRSFSTQFAEFEAFSIPFSEQYINEHLPIEDLLVTVVGSTVSYPMRLMKSKGKQATFTTGWNKLVGDKLFELCDVCVFMFSENDAELTLSLELLNNFRVLNPLLTKLSSLIEGEYKLLKSVKKDIIFLRNELSSISVLLEHLSNKEDKLDGPTMEWRNNMLELAYDIEDCIDLFIHKLSCGDANANFVRKIGSKIKKLWGKHQITECIQELKNRIDDFISEPSMVEIDPRLLALYEEVERLVGIDGPREKIVKTTLANELYKTIQGDFKCTTFVSISRTPNIRKVLVDMLKGLGSNGDVSEDEQNLISHLRGFLKDKSRVERRKAGYRSFIGDGRQGGLRAIAGEAALGRRRARRP
uniref:Uncharacterized protein n=1 Tax=Oryza barthii TaxID=65489 RepID=A0A0D3HT51_9ORYZ